MTTFYHNPRCSKSREALHLLEEKGETLDVIKYLENPPTKQVLKQILKLLGIDPIDLVRTQEKDWIEHYKGKDFSNDEVIEAILKYPKLMERPIAVKGLHAVIGRPPEKVLEIL